MALVDFAVTQEHIDKGERFEPCLCPVALSIKSRLNLDLVSVRCTELGLWGHDTVCETLMPPTLVQEFISDFDIGGRDDVKPFAFSLDLPAHFAELVLDPSTSNPV